MTTQYPLQQYQYQILQAVGVLQLFATDAAGVAGVL